MMKGKEFDLQDQFIDFAVMNPHLDIGYPLLGIQMSEHESPTSILDIPCWILDIRYLIKYE